MVFSAVRVVTVFGVRAFDKFEYLPCSMPRGACSLE